METFAFSDLTRSGASALIGNLTARIAVLQQLESDLLEAGSRGLADLVAQQIKDTQSGIERLCMHIDILCRRSS